MASEMEDYLVEFFKIKPHGSREDRQDFLARIAEAGNEENCAAKKWSQLEKDNEAAQDWVIAAQKAIEDEEEIEDFEDDDGADDAEEEKPAARGKARGKTAAPAKGKDRKAEEPEDDEGDDDEGDDEGDDSEDDDAEEEKPARGRGARGRRAADEEEDAEEEKPARGRGARGRKTEEPEDDAGDDEGDDADTEVADSVKVTIKKLVFATPNISAAAITKKLPKGTKISSTAINYIKTEFKHSIKVLQSLKANFAKK